MNTCFGGHDFTLSQRMVHGPDRRIISMRHDNDGVFPQLWPQLKVFRLPQPATLG
jgi:hypothetical protein